MPLYEYQCAVCDNRFERIQKFSDPLVEICPSCGGAVRKLLSSPAIQFKGSGWYITDYAKKTASKSDDSKSSASPATSSGESSSSGSAGSSGSSSPGSTSGTGTSGSSGKTGGSGSSSGS